MITLQRLHVNNFKGLREVEFVFPQQGSVLIEGHNEAGKSTLFEAVYVALYGKPLVGENERARQEEVIQHGQSKATVELVVSVGQQTLTITRIFERGKTQYATLLIQQPGTEPETVSRVRPVDERILKELGNLDGESLRNSCFVEQKELGRIEALQRSDREQAIQKLLGLEHLTRLMDEFKPRREQERELAKAEKYLTLAQFQAKIRALSAQEATLAERLDAVKVAAHLKSLADGVRQRESIEQRLSELASSVQQAQTRLNHWSALREQIVGCDQIPQSLTHVSHARHELNRIKTDLVRLEHIERVDLPAAQTYLDEVSTTAEAVIQVVQKRTEVQAAEAGVREAQRLLAQLQQAEADQQTKEEDVSHAQQRLDQREEEAKTERERLVAQLHALDAKKGRLEQAHDLVTQWEAACQKLSEIQSEIITTKNRQQVLVKLQADIQQREGVAREVMGATNRAEQRQQQATETVRLVTAYDGLTAWIRLKGVESALSSYTERQAELLVSKQTDETTLLAERARMQRPLLASIALTVLTVLALVAGLLWLPVLIVFVFLAGGALACWLWFRRMRKRVQQQSNNVAQWEAELQRLDMQRQAAIQTGGDPAALQYHERQIQEIGLVVPSSLDVGQRLQKDLQRQVSTIELRPAREAEQIARDSHVRLREQLKQAQTALEESRRAWQMAQQAGNPAEQLNQLASQVVDQEQIVALAEQKASQSVGTDSPWPTKSYAVQTMLAACQADLRSTAESQNQQEVAATRLLLEAQTDLAAKRDTLRQVQENVSRQKAADPATQVSRAHDTWVAVQALCRQQEAIVQHLLQKINLPAEREVEPERGRAEARVQACERELATRPEQQKKCKTQTSDFIQKGSVAAALIEGLLAVAQNLAVADLPLLPQTEKNDDSSFPFEEIWATTLENVRTALQNTQDGLDEPGTRNARDTALSEQGRLKEQVSLLAHNSRESQQSIAALFSKRNLGYPSAYTQDAVVVSWPLVGLVTAAEQEQVAQELEEASRQLYATRHQESALATELSHPGTPLKVEECQQKVDILREEQEIGVRAYKLLRETHDRIARRVLPITERNMQPLLQKLTSGRYRDVRLTPEDTNGQPGEMDYRIRVWDSVAGRFVAKNLFSGGTRDQCSLALRLAFALATLPQELGIAPGFIFLDEPLSAFDAQRAQALVELLTTGTIAQQFSQVILISHSHAFDREAFRYHVRMEAGQIVESNLPNLGDPEVVLSMA